MVLGSIISTIGSIGTAASLFGIGTFLAGGGIGLGGILTGIGVLLGGGGIYAAGKDVGVASKDLSDEVNRLTTFLFVTAWPEIYNTLKEVQDTLFTLTNLLLVVAIFVCMVGYIYLSKNLEDLKRQRTWLQVLLRINYDLQARFTMVVLTFFQIVFVLIAVVFVCYFISKLKIILQILFITTACILTIVLVSRDLRKKCANGLKPVKYFFVYVPQSYSKIKTNRKRLCVILVHTFLYFLFTTFLIITSQLFYPLVFKTFDINDVMHKSTLFFICTVLSHVLWILAGVATFKIYKI